MRPHHLPPVLFAVGALVAATLSISTGAAQASGAHAATASATAAQPCSTDTHGSEPPTELTGCGPTPIPLKNMAMVKNTEWGLRFIAGQQDSKLKVTYADGRVTFRDRGTKKWRTLPERCHAKHVRKGIKAICKNPRDGDFIQIWPRLGNDRIDGHTLPAQLRFWVLTDRGDDVVRGGAGDDFVNGGQGRDTVHGNDGDDRLRTGIEADVLWGGNGNDTLTAVDGDDELHGEAGDDVLEAGPGDDQMWGDDGADRLKCAGGQDTYDFDPADTQHYQCDVVRQS